MKLAPHPARLSHVAALLLALAASASVRAETDSVDAEPLWPEFRGADFSGVIPDAADIPLTWSEEENVAWKTPILGRGWSSPVVAEDRVFLTTSINSGETEAPKPGLYFGGNREKMETLHEWKVLCLDLATGSIAWEYTVHKGVPPQARHLKNSFASETPVTDGKRLHAYFGNVGLFTFDMEGKLLWARSWEPVEIRHGWGTAASPVLHEGVLYVLNDNENQSWFTALDAATGDTRWKIERDEGSNWSTPFVWEHAEGTELVTTGTGKVRSYDLDGRLLWSLGGFSSITVPTPFAAEGLLYIGSGYVGDDQRPFLAVKPGARGDISLEDGEAGNEHIAWAHAQIAPYMPTPIVYDGFLYILLDRGMLHCLNARTGEILYDRKRLGRHGEFNASPLAYSGRILCFSERGDTVLVKAGEAFEVEGVNSLDEMIMATPAVAGDRLLIRTMEHLYCLRKGAGASKPNTPPAAEDHANGEEETHPGE